MESKENQEIRLLNLLKPIPVPTSRDIIDVGSTQGTSFGDQQDNALQDYVHIINYIIM